MTLQDQAKAFRATFGQECLPNISHYGFIKKQMWDMQTSLIEEESVERFVGANNIIEHLQATLDAYTYAHPE